MFVRTLALSILAATAAFGQVSALVNGQNTSLTMVNVTVDTKADGKSVMGSMAAAQAEAQVQHLGISAIVNSGLYHVPVVGGAAAAGLGMVGGVFHKKNTDVYTAYTMPAGNPPSVSGSASFSVPASFNGLKITLLKAAPSDANPSMWILRADHSQVSSKGETKLVESKQVEIATTARAENGSTVLSPTNPLPAGLYVVVGMDPEGTSIAFAFPFKVN